MGLQLLAVQVPFPSTTIGVAKPILDEPSYVAYECIRESPISPCLGRGAPLPIGRFQRPDR